MQNVYAALLLHKLGKPIDEAGMKNILQAAGASVDESSIKTLIASLMKLLKLKYATLLRFLILVSYLKNR